VRWKNTKSIKISQNYKDKYYSFFARKPWRYVLKTVQKILYIFTLTIYSKIRYNCNWTGGRLFGLNWPPRPLFELSLQVLAPFPKKRSSVFFFALLRLATERIRARHFAHYAPRSTVNYWKNALTSCSAQVEESWKLRQGNNACFVCYSSPLKFLDR
jgi:hypothetical protein